MTSSEGLLSVARSLYDRRLTPGTSGNVSVRTDSGFLLTPTNSCLGRLEMDALACLDGDGAYVSGGAPSKEWSLHLAFYRLRPDVRAVVHLHSPWAVAVSCLKGMNTENSLPALTGYHAMRLGRVPLVAYHPPGSAALASAVAERAGGAHALLLANHGSIVAAADLGTAADGAEQLEQSAQLFILLDGREVTGVPMPGEPQ